MSKTHEMPDLNKTLTYGDYCEIASEAWLYAEEKTTVYPDATFRRQFFQYIEDMVAGKEVVNPFKGTTKKIGEL